MHEGISTVDESVSSPLVIPVQLMAYSNEIIKKTVEMCQGSILIVTFRKLSKIMLSS